jgi:hypothetical protein
MMWVEDRQRQSAGERPSRFTVNSGFGSPNTRHLRQSLAQARCCVRVIADKAYDSDLLRTRLRRRGMELNCPRKTKVAFVPPPEMGAGCAVIGAAGSSSARPLGFGNFRRLGVRYDRSLIIYQAFFHIARSMIVLRRVVQ